MRSPSIVAAALLGSLLVPASALAQGRVCMVVSEPAFVESLDLVEATAKVGTQREARDEGVVLWCASADDPRCAPVRNDEQPQTDWLRGPQKSGGPDPDDVAAPAATEVQFVSDPTGPSRGVRHRVERPPRA